MNPVLFPSLTSHLPVAWFLTDFWVEDYLVGLYGVPYKIAMENYLFFAWIMGLLLYLSHYYWFILSLCLLTMSGSKYCICLHTSYLCGMSVACFIFFPQSSLSTDKMMLASQSNRNTLTTMAKCFEQVRVTIIISIIIIYFEPPFSSF